MASVNKIREGLFNISWINQTFVASNQVEVNCKEVFQFCKLKYNVVGNTQIILEMELTFTKEIRKRPWRTSELWSPNIVSSNL